MTYAVIIAFIIQGKLVRVMEPVNDLTSCRVRAQVINITDENAVAMCAMVMYDKDSLEKLEKGFNNDKGSKK
ncbi:hypothetical protein EBT25_05215 [bacterium]|nr:hypothetical protein [bacterium]